MLTYRHLTVENAVRPLALAPVPAPARDSASVHKVQVPSLVRDVFQVGYSINLFVPSGKENSLWHCLQWATERRSTLFTKDTRSYTERCADAEQFATNCKQRARKQTHEYLSLAKLKFGACTDATLMLLAVTLQLHIVVVERFPVPRWRHYYVSESDGWPIVLLVRSTMDWFHLTVINDTVQFVRGTPMYHGLMRTASTEVARSLLDSRCTANTPLYYQLTGATPADVKLDAMRKELFRYKVVELRQLAASQGISLPSRILKADLVERLLKKN